MNELRRQPTEENVDDLSASSFDRSAERVLRLFNLTYSYGEDLRDAEEKILSVIRGYLDVGSTSSNADIAGLVKSFCDTEIPPGTFDLDSYINYIAEKIVPHSVRTSSPRFIGHMTSALPSFFMPLQSLITAMNQNLVKMETSKVLTLYERQALVMIHRLVYNLDPTFYAQHIHGAKSTLGIITSGGTLSNITALWCARNSSLGPCDGFLGVETEGLQAGLAHYGYNGAVVIGSRLMHYSFDKAVGVLGLGTKGLVKLPTNIRGELEVAALRNAVAASRKEGKHIIALIGVGGVTDSGSIDPLMEIAEIAAEEKIHFHVDAAWGGPVLLSSKHRRKLEGIACADTVTIDGHKQLYLPMGVGITLFKDPSMAQAIEKVANYIIRANSRDLGKRSLEGSRPDRATLLHASLHIIGRRGYEYLIDEGIRKAEYMADCIRRLPEFELIYEPRINILNYRYLPETLRKKVRKGDIGAAENLEINAVNEKLQKSQRRTGSSFVSRTVLDCTKYSVPIVALRAVIANPLTKESDIDAVLEEQIRIASSIC
jgi:putative pyridoxal-dependent aspartate 1-decarboxylase